MKKIIVLILMLISVSTLKANVINADSSNYTSFLNTLVPGDTLILVQGNYTDRLNIVSLVGTSSNPIVIMGSGNNTVFLGNACCNTVSIRESAYITLKDFKIDGQNIINIDGIKAEGTAGNWAHNIVLENLLIVGHGANQQTVGISTKCPAWDWVIRKCTIDGAGTGMYFGDSNGDSPFINGIIENNLIKNTIGYNIQIKHQNVGSRNIAGMTLNGKTIIRHNVLSKENNASSGGNARPNLLVGNFPDTGDGSNDYYEIYGNFIWQNPYSSLFQGTGNISFYNNVCVNYAGGNGIAIQSHNGFLPRDIKIFHNTIVCDINWGIRLMDTDTAYQKYVYGNAVFSNHATPIRLVGVGVSTANLSDNIVDVVANANNYVNNASNNISTIDLYPLAGSALNSTVIPNALFSSYTDYNVDFNLDARNWQYRGAYSGEGTNPGWHLAIEMKIIPGSTVSVSELNTNSRIKVYPNPTNGIVNLEIPFPNYDISIYNINGQLIDNQYNNQLDFSELRSGVYYIRITAGKYSQVLNILKK